MFVMPRRSRAFALRAPLRSGTHGYPKAPNVGLAARVEPVAIRRPAVAAFPILYALQHDLATVEPFL
jgi:hypothetical protein